MSKRKTGFLCLIALAVTSVAVTTAHAQNDILVRKTKTKATQNLKTVFRSLDYNDAHAFDASGRLLLSNRTIGFDASGRLLQSNRTIGVTVAPTDPVLRAHLKLNKGKYGVVVTRVLPNSRAAKAGMRPHDIVLSVNGTPVSAGTDLSAAVKSAGKKPITIVFMRSGKQQTLAVRQISKQTVRWIDLSTGVVSSRFRPTYTIGVETQPADPSLVAQLVLPPSTGLVVRQVQSKSPAAKAGIQKHDVILKAADKYLSNPDDLRKAVVKAAGKPLTLEFLRSGRKQSCTVTPRKRDKGLIWYVESSLRGVVVREFAMPRFNFVRDRHPVIIGNILYSGAVRPTDVNTQIDRMSRQLDALRKSLDRLKTSLAKAQSKPKRKLPSGKKK